MSFSISESRKLFSSSRIRALSTAGSSLSGGTCSTARPCPRFLSQFSKVPSGTPNSKAALVGLIGIGPKDELEAMMAAQLIAAHSAAIECYRRAMIGEQTFEGRRENLGMRGLGVLWGYGTRDELESAGADQLVESTVDLACTVLAMVSGKRPST